jgi:hypothetical protein
LCGIIHRILKKRGGYWITADIYIKKEFDKNFFRVDNKLREFAKQHNIDENKFNDIAEAESFFKAMGFIIDKEAEPDYSKLTSLNHVFKTGSEQQLQCLKNIRKIQTTWRLKPK